MIEDGENMPEDKKSNSETLRELYLKSGLSYTQIAECTGVKYSTIVSWLCKRRNPPDYVMDILIKSIKEEERKCRKSKERERRNENK